MLYIFDKDGTLVGSHNSKRPANTPDEQILLPGVAEKITQLRIEGHQIAIASNQGGVAWGFITEEQAQDLVDDCAAKIGGVDAWAWCPHDERAKGKPNSNPKYAAKCTCRKPDTGLLDICITTADVARSLTVFVGDQETDRQAAEKAGIQFVWAKDFFGWGQP
jgi:D-glycero-D-manno-heptose 1,7-bisphosphate phosphatase